MKEIGEESTDRAIFLPKDAGPQSCHGHLTFTAGTHNLPPRSLS